MTTTRHPEDLQPQQSADTRADFSALTRCWMDDPDWRAIASLTDPSSAPVIPAAGDGPIPAADPVHALAEDMGGAVSSPVNAAVLDRPAPVHPIGDQGRFVRYYGMEGLPKGALTAGTQGGTAILSPVGGVVGAMSVLSLHGTPGVMVTIGDVRCWWPASSFDTAWSRLRHYLATGRDVGPDKVQPIWGP